VSPQGRVLLGKRSTEVKNPGRWDGWGGSKEPNETYEQCALRELFEETGYDGPMWLYLIEPPFRFVGAVPYEYTPRLNWETARAAWFAPHELPGLQPKNWGLAELLKDRYAMHVIASLERRR
jgi:8-oxo-dGTP pyrophosphatase MutT (NUDIX family)